MKILIVDDEDLVRKSLARVFKSRGYEVFEAEGGKQGLEKWLQNKPDIVLLDVLMPDISGPKVLEQISDKGFVVLMSAFKGEYDSETALSLGANDFVPKPFEDIFLTADQIEKSYFLFMESKNKL